MEAFTSYLIAPLLTDPTQIEVSLVGSNLVVTVPQADMGKVIGKQGNSIKHLRTLIRTYCKLHQLPSYLLSVQPK